MYEKILKEIEKVNILEDNADVIARGGGSPQARWADQCCKGGDCPVCNPPEEEDDEEIEETKKKYVVVGDGYKRSFDTEEEAKETIKELEQIAAPGSIFDIEVKTVNEDGTWLASPKVDVQQRNFDLNPKKDEEETY